jgi:hypothetical protein
LKEKASKEPTMEAERNFKNNEINTIVNKDPFGIQIELVTEEIGAYHISLDIDEENNCKINDIQKSEQNLQ